VTTIIDIIAMVTNPSYHNSWANIVKLHIGFDLIKLGVGIGSEDDAINGLEGLVHVSKVC